MSTFPAGFCGSYHRIGHPEFQCESTNGSNGFEFETLPKEYTTEIKVGWRQDPVANTSIGKTVQPSPPPSLTEHEGAERTRYYTRVHSGSRSMEVARVASPPCLVLNAEGLQSKNVSAHDR